MFVADLHVHSKYSRATAKNLDLENLFIAAQLKGISVVATGDFTHPGWFAEIEAKLVPTENGLFRLKPELASACRQEVPVACHRPVRFMLATEISNIYKKDNRTRKNHNLVFFPSLEAVAAFNRQLAEIGNLASDGRPILGLDARNLLEIVLENDSRGFLVPAHIWTPWFSLLGSKSGFDSVSECFEDLSDHIFAIETGLSSDPPMNWRVSQLDGLTLVSNSDAHSPQKLGREANLLETDMGYEGIREAIESGDSDRFLGTLEFFPEEGKYHFDGHRKCGVSSHPHETQTLNGVCPVCGKALTLGVLYRVEQLADRKPGVQAPQPTAYHRRVPLVDILSEIFQVGPATKKVGRCYRELVTSLGPELMILNEVDFETLNRSGVPLLGEAIARMRAGRIKIAPGFDGEFGIVRLFSDGERAQLVGQRSLFRGQRNHSQSEPKGEATTPTPSPLGLHPGAPSRPDRPAPASWPHILECLNHRQKAAVTHSDGPLLIIAGPGTGKTLTLTCRIAWLLSQRKVGPEGVLAVTFTQKAAGEMKQRLQKWLGESVLPQVGTFHGWCRQLIREASFGQVAEMALLDKEEHLEVVAEARRQVQAMVPEPLPPSRTLSEQIVKAKQMLLAPTDDLRPIVADGPMDTLMKVYTRYQNICTAQHSMDFEDLIYLVVRRVERDQQFRQHLRNRFRYLFVDEYQDLNHGQYRLLKALTRPDSNICVIGDPNQAIYGFRGSDVAFFHRFTQDYPNASQINLTRNYRSVETILECAHSIIHRPADPDFPKISSGIDGGSKVQVVSVASARAEAVVIGKTVEKLIGGTGFHSLDFDHVDGVASESGIGFSDIAVLVRTREQGKLLADELGKAGIPAQMASRAHWRGVAACKQLRALLRLTTGCARYGDLDRLKDLLRPGIGSTTLDALKTWGIHNHWTATHALRQMKRFPIAGLDGKRQKSMVDHFNRIGDVYRSLAKQPMPHWIDTVLNRTRLRSRFDKDERSRAALDQVLKLASESGDRMALENRMAMQSDPDFIDPSVQKVSVMTLHSAKGLEYPVVFIAGCEDGLIPFSHSDRPTDMHEERRLLYVGVTRARQRLFLTWSRRRRRYGTTIDSVLSSFVEQIPRRLLVHTQRSMRAPRSQGPVQLGLFDLFDSPEESA
jgi:DNA helicase-2/ATP-dependent DNA helicase PcrA